MYFFSSISAYSTGEYITSINAQEAEANGAGVPLKLLSNVADSIKNLLKEKIYF